MEIYSILNYKIIDTTAEYMQSYNWIYQPFNLVEGIIWFAYIPKTIFKYWGKSDKSLVIWQCISFLLFGISDLIEVNATTLLLVLFKLAILVALIVGHKAIIGSMEKLPNK